jgi:molecular chaperone GrpE
VSERRHDDERRRPPQDAAGAPDADSSAAQADPTEPAGDQDPSVEAERLAEADRARGAHSEDEDSAGAGEQGPGVGSGPEDPLAAVSAERDEYLSLAQRTQADFENYRKRAARDIAAASARGKAALARELLPVVDNLERALESAAEGDAGLLEGVKLVHSELTAALERNGVESIEPGGEQFDPNIHEALSTRSENGAEAGVVLDVVQKGYRLDQTVLRPARVVVAA